MTDKTISPLRQRMIEDMRIRGFMPTTQRGYIAAVRDFTAFFGRSPDQAEAEDLLTSAPRSGRLAAASVPRSEHDADLPR